MADTSILKGNSSIVPVKTDQCDRADLLDYFQNSWKLYEWLFSSLSSDETFYMAPDRLRHPLIFYWGHTAAFYINKLVMAGLLEKGINERYEVLFAKGVDPDLPDNLQKQLQWPDVAAVDSYRKEVFDTVVHLINTTPLDGPIDPDHPLWALLMGIEHDRIHFETSSVLIRQLPVEQVNRPESWKYAPTFGSPPANQLIAVPGGTVEIGKPADSNIFGWDNEFGYLKKTVDPFHAGKNLVSNETYLDFVESGAYNDLQYWTEEGSAWKVRVGSRHPKFWLRQGDAFQYRAMFDLLPLPLDWPVEINAHEAWAYCRWKGEGWRLLTEAEFYLIGHKALGEEDCVFSDAYNLNMQYGSPTPVGFMKEGQTALGFNDLFGNVWDWLMDDFYPLPGFEPHYLYEDFSAPYFDNAHSMLAGGAWVTTGTGASKYYRLWFRRHFYQHAGFRLARSL
ncbi:MAG: 5-histidylcysteine sulfoxide synthase [Saprospirales bacterium]|nr:5-histidylcysteine sulfoxide synthase [Saprospirales bacterium]